MVLFLLGFHPYPFGGNNLNSKLAAVTQPVADKQITDAFPLVGEGCRLLLRVLLTVELLLVAIAIFIRPHLFLINCIKYLFEKERRKPMLSQLYSWLQNVVYLSPSYSGYEFTS